MLIDDQTVKYRIIKEKKWNMGIGWQNDSTKSQSVRFLVNWSHDTKNIMLTLMASRKKKKKSIPSYILKKTEANLLSIHTSEP